MAIQDEIYSLIKLVEAWRLRKQLFAIESDTFGMDIAAEYPRRPREEWGERLLQLSGEANEIAASIRTVGKQLAQLLTSKGHDPAPVLKVVHFAGPGSGGVGALSPLWADIKVELQTLAIASPNGTDDPPRGGATVNARMIDVLAKRPESREWTAKQFAEHLECGDSTVKGSPAWKALMTERAGVQLSRSRRHY